MDMESSHGPSVSDVAAEARAQVEEWRGRLDELGKQAVDFVRQRPGTSLLIAVGAGYLIGRILR
jgi:hypothetical protein